MNFCTVCGTLLLGHHSCGGSATYCGACGRSIHHGPCMPETTAQFRKRMLLRSGTVSPAESVASRADGAGTPSAFSEEG